MKIFFFAEYFVSENFPDNPRVDQAKGTAEGKTGNFSNFAFLGSI